jgi:hypothetical protein
MSTFEAKWGGKCAGCGERIHEGDLCTYADDALVHADCPEPVDPLRLQRPVCAKCFTEVPVTGTCGCDD